MQDQEIQVRLISYGTHQLLAVNLLREKIKMDLRETGLGGVYRFHVAQEWGWWRALVNAAINLWVS
jgi:hypothetical protein